MRHDPFSACQYVLQAAGLANLSAGQAVICAKWRQIPLQQTLAICLHFAQPQITAVVYKAGMCIGLYHYTWASKSKPHYTNRLYTLALWLACVVQDYLNASLRLVVMCQRKTSKNWCERQTYAFILLIPEKFSRFLQYRDCVALLLEIKVMMMVDFRRHEMTDKIHQM